jgi:hypothetical protein
MLVKRSIFCFLIPIFLFFCGPAKSQRYFGVSGEIFGKNRIQTRRFEWKTIKSNNFEFNFYRGGENLAIAAAAKAEQEYSRITETLGYTPFGVMKVFVYNTPNDLKQSNIGLSAPIESDASGINLAKTRIQLAYNKNDSLFHHALIKEITKLFVYDMLYGGSLKEAVQSQLLLMVPAWYIDGIASYMAESNNSTQFEVFKKMIAAIDTKKLSNLEGQQAKIVGQSIWHYIALKYGSDNISNILNLTRIIRNEQSSITSTLGVSFPKFLKEWKAFYLENQAQEPVIVQTLTQKKIDENNNTQRLVVLDSNEVDTEFYEFEPKNIVNFTLKKDTFLKDDKPTEGHLGSNAKRVGDEFKLTTTKAYQNLLVSNENKSSVVIDPVRRFGVGGELAFNDLLENHILTFKGYLKPSSPFFKNYDYTIAYTNNVKKVDLKFQYFRRSINLESIDASNEFLFRPLKIFPFDGNAISISRRVLSQRLMATASYPFSENLRLDVSPYFLKVTDIEYEIPGRNDLSNNFLSTDVSAVFDNTTTISKQVLLGTRGKISLEKNMSLANSLASFNRLNVDLRHYQRLVKGVVLAGRFSFGKSTGHAPKYTFLGGVENAINRTIYASEGLLPGEAGDFRDILFYNFSGQLRGFDFARLFGNNHILTNLELRASLVEYFPRSSLSSSFLRSFQFVVFNDIGTAWNGTKGPFNKQNSLNTILIGTDGRSPFFAEVTNFKNPFLMSFGVGLRTTLLGVLLKADYGFGVEDKQTNKPKLQLSIGSDF